MLGLVQQGGSGVGGVLVASCRRRVPGGETPPRPQSLVHSKRAIGYVCAEEGGIGSLGLNEVTTLALEQWLDGHKRISRGRAARQAT